jgi:uncharacterized membrane protein YdjX (TVP38/TMEM64 family)
MTDNSRARRIKWILFASVVVTVALAAAWKWTPLHEYAEPKLVAHWLVEARSSPWLPLLIVALFVGGNAVMFPHTVLTVATILALGSWTGFAYATGGAMVAAVVAYALARRYGPDHIKDLKIKSMERIGAALKRGTIAQIFMLRLLPLAPFGVVNVMAGISHVRVVPYVIGTFLGLLPGNLLLTAFGRQLRRMFQDPHPLDIAGLVAVVLAISLMMWWLHKKAQPAKR